jgi:hypothetical protein
VFANTQTGRRLCGDSRGMNEDDRLFMRAWHGRRDLSLAARDPLARAARVEVCLGLADGLRDVGQLLHVCGNIVGSDRVNGSSPFGNGSDAVVGLAGIIRIGALLCRGIVDLLNAGNVYSAAALSRQLVEVEYLSWAFANDHEEASSWLRSSREERLSRWQPRHLRNRAGTRFRAQDYADHCESGGHPTPAGALRLVDGPPKMADFIWYEAAIHGSSVWSYMIDAANALGTVGCIPDDLEIRVRQKVLAWESRDQLIALFARPPG